MPGQKHAVGVKFTIWRPPGTAWMTTRSTTVAITASSRFDTGPARVTMFSSRRILAKLRLMTGVGFAQPIRIPLKRVKPMNGPKMMMAGMMRVPTDVDVVDGVQGDAALHSCGLVAEPRRHPGVRALVHAQREDEQNKLEDCNCKFGRLHQTLPGFGKLRLAWCGALAFRCALDLVCRIVADDFAGADVGAAHDDFVAADAGAVADGGWLELHVVRALIRIAVREDARRRSR